MTTRPNATGPAKPGPTTSCACCAPPSRAPKAGPSRAIRTSHAAPASAGARPGKQALLIEMLRRPEGATIAQIITATGWQAHTVRGAVAGALKKRRGLMVTSEKSEGAERVYRIAE